jgi:hypothetical protein
MCLANATQKQEGAILISLAQIPAPQFHDLTTDFVSRPLNLGVICHVTKDN